MSIFKPKNSNKYHYRYSVNGKIYTGSTKTSNKALAERYEHQMKETTYREIQFGEYPPITIFDALKNFLKAKRKLPSHGTYTTRSLKLLGGVVVDEAGVAKKTCHGFDHTRELHTIKDKDIAKLLAEREAEGLSMSSILQELVVLNQSIKIAKRQGFKVPDINMAEIRKENNIKPSKGKLRYLTREEEAALLKELNAEGTSNQTNRGRKDTHDLVVMLLDTGARHTEISTLKWSDVNLDEKTINLYRPKVNNQSVLHMSDRVYKLLVEREKNKKGLFIFPSASGKASRNYTSVAFRTAVDAAGLVNVTFHTLRHTFCSRMVQAGLPITDIQQIVGHADIHMTLRYAHLAPLQSSSKAVQILNEMNASK